MRHLGRWLKWGLLALIGLFLAWQLWLLGWVLLWKWVDPGTTRFMEIRLAELQVRNPAARLQQQWLPYRQISPYLKRAIIASEDAKFVDHEGFDWEGIQKAMEKNQKKKKILRLFLIIGACLSTYYATCLVLFNVNPEVMDYHIKYHTGFPKSMALVTFAIYLTVTITPLFISSIKKTHLMGILMFLSCAVTAIFFTQFLTSVWCFFAAIISVVIFWILRDSKRKFNFDNMLII